MKTVSTTFRCTSGEKEAIELKAKNKGMYTQDYVLECLQKSLPVKSVPYFNKLIKRENPIGIKIPGALHKKLMKNQKSLSSGIRKVKLWEVMIFCCLEKKEWDAGKS